MLVPDKYMAAFPCESVDGEPDWRTLTKELVKCAFRDGARAHDLRNVEGLQIAYIRERLLAAFMITDMRFFAGVSSRMYCQSTALDEALVAVLYCALIRSLVGVNAIMATEIGLAIERLNTRVVRAVYRQISRLSTEVKSRNRRRTKHTLPHCSQVQLKSRPLPGAIIAAYWVAGEVKAGRKRSRRREIKSRSQSGAGRSGHQRKRS